MAFGRQKTSLNALQAVLRGGETFHLSQGSLNVLRCTLSGTKIGSAQFRIGHQLFDGGLPPFATGVRIDRRDRHAAVPEVLLHLFNFRTGFQGMGGMGMA